MKKIIYTIIALSSLAIVSCTQKNVTCSTVRDDSEARTYSDNSTETITSSTETKQTFEEMSSEEIAKKEAQGTYSYVFTGSGFSFAKAMSYDYSTTRKYKVTCDKK